MFEQNGEASHGESIVKYIAPGAGVTILGNGRIVSREQGDAYMKAARMAPAKRDAAWLAHGAKGKAKHLLGLDQLPPEAVKVRLAICKPCPKRNGKTGECDLCWCNLRQKAQQRSERCPAGLWPEPGS